MTFLNVDLEIASETSLAPLLDALLPTVVVLFHQAESGRHHATLELDIDPCGPANPDEGILSFCRLIRALAPEARHCWNHLSLRQFDIGYDASQPPHATQMSLDTTTWWHWLR